MSDLAIRVENLSKRYRIGLKEEGHGGIVGTIAGLASRPIKNWRRLRKLSNFRESNQDPEDIIWALNDVSFEIKMGDVVGIIGGNGAGKSTLLKILSRITEPTSGYAVVNGRVGALLEVGTGFHPELTGRENVYLNGAVLGMTRKDIARKFDAIVDFSGVEKFIDTPVKRYSSGMKVRLGFAVAAHLEPEILIVDEILSVGDAAFQKKCLGKMGDVAREGRTVMFVSHNMIAVRNLCAWSIWLEDGGINQTGDTSSVVEAYLRQSLRVDSLADVAAAIRSLPPDPAFRLDAMAIRQNGQPGNVVVNGQPIEIEIQYTVLQRTTGLRVYFDLHDDERNILIRTFHDDDAKAIPTVEPGEYVSIATIPANLLAPREYEIRVHGTIYNVRSCTPGGVGLPLVVQANSGVNSGYPQDTIRSKLQPKIPWSTQYRQDQPATAPFTR